MIGGRRKGDARLAEIEAALAEMGANPCWPRLLPHRMSRRHGKGSAIDRRRAVVGALMEITLYPSGRGARVFDPARVLPEERGIVWR